MTDTAVVAPPPKLDPETLAIRGRPPRAIRFKCGVIIAIAAIGSVSLIAVTWMALKPRLFHGAETQEELSQPNVRPSSDALTGAPSTYSDVPRLGPPLPGDLGKPILEHQQTTIASVDPAGQQLQQAQAAERERQLSELKAARESGVLVQNRQGTGATGTVPVAAPASSTATAETPKLTLDAANDPNAQGHKAEFVANVDRQGGVNPHALTPLPSPYTLSAGSVISASLITGLRSDLPGLVTAQVTENTYDSATGRILLVPQGARLIGSYDSVVAFGQKRALIVWQRIIMPDGASLRIDNVPATDPSGYAGLQDKVDLHTWQLLKGIALSTLLGVGSDLALSGQGDLVQAIRQSTQDSVSRLATRSRSETSASSRRSRSGPARQLGWSSTRILCSRPWERGEMAALKLAKLPDRTPVKLAITLVPDLKRSLDDYAELYREIYGQSETVVDLIPHMLASFLSSDRAFSKAREVLGGERE